MKTRQGFVSNSSSSSFLIYGEGHDSLTIKGEELSGYALYDALQGMVEEMGLELDVQPGQDAYNVYIGRSWDSVKDDETGKQFKDSVARDIEKLLGRPAECDTHEEAWYNG